MFEENRFVFLIFRNGKNGLSSQSWLLFYFKVFPDCQTSSSIALSSSFSHHSTVLYNHCWWNVWALTLSLYVWRRVLKSHSSQFDQFTYGGMYLWKPLAEIYPAVMLVERQGHMLSNFISSCHFVLLHLLTPWRSDLAMTVYIKVFINTIKHWL